MEEYLIISNRQECVRIASDDIVYIMSDVNYSKIYIPNVLGDTPYLATITIGEVGKALYDQLTKSAGNFIRVGRQLIINKQHLFSISLTNGNIGLLFPTGIHYVPASKEALKNLMGIIDNK